MTKVNETYNEEEVKELFDVVFKLSAKDINDKLIKVGNRPEIAKRRWFWELLQNAKDAVKPDEKVSIKLIIGSENERPYIEFLHNGNPFRYQDAKNLIFPYSDKGEEENSDKSGRFGTGFLATHILSKKINVKGVYLKDGQAFDFSFTLDRSGVDKPEIAGSINTTWQEFRVKRNVKPDYVYEQKNFETSFRYDLDGKGLSLIDSSITDFSNSIPFTLAFIPKINTIEINNTITGTVTLFRNCENEIKSLTDNIRQYTIEKTIENTANDVQENKINLVVCSDGEVDIALEIFDKDKRTFIKEFEEHQPLLFCPFPLIGANDFKFPTAINSLSFLPKEERDGIWLGDDGYGPTNQSLFEKAIPLYECLSKYASSQSWQNSYLLLKSLKDTPLIADFNSKWFKEKIQLPIKQFAKQIPLVDLPNGNRIAIAANGQIVYFQNEPKEENRSQLWEFVKALFPDGVPSKEQIHNWYDVMWDDCPKYSINTFVKYIANFKTVEHLQTTLGKTKDETLEWLNELVSLVAKEEPALLNGKDSPILPNQFGFFKRKDELYLDDEIEQELKEILSSLCGFSKKITDWRTDLLDCKIFLELPSSRTRNLAQIGITITDTVKELLKEDNPANELKDVFSRLLNWLNDNPKQAKDHFKGLKTETLLYKTANENNIKYVTEMLQKDRSGELSLEQQFGILNDPQKIKLLTDPDLELKITLGEEVLADRKKEQDEFEFKKKTGDVFESAFRSIIKEDDRFSITTVEGEQDFIVTNNSSNKKFYIELKSVRSGVEYIQMTHKQAKKASEHSESYFLCIIPNDGTDIDEDYFKLNALFDGTIGKKLSKKITEAIAFEASENGIMVEFEDNLLAYYNKYRYKFQIPYTTWKQDKFETFINQIAE
ncbi:MAG: DUF3883 domain-containing protein [Parachlamydiaceae bacterium]|nr:DUF3883 domain-containing protein [Parachlamydiaceae bacterium]